MAEIDQVVSMNTVDLPKYSLDCLWRYDHLYRQLHRMQNLLLGDGISITKVIHGQQKAKNEQVNFSGQYLINFAVQFGLMVINGNLNKGDFTYVSEAAVLLTVF